MPNFVLTGSLVSHQTPPQMNKLLVYCEHYNSRISSLWTVKESRLRKLYFGQSATKVLNYIVIIIMGIISTATIHDWAMDLTANNNIIYSRHHPLDRFKSIAFRRLARQSSAVCSSVHSSLGQLRSIWSSCRWVSQLFFTLSTWNII